MSLIFGHIPLAGYEMDQSMAFEITRRSPTRVISKANADVVACATYGLQPRAIVKTLIANL